MILPGSYANCFAPRDGQPLYPELWRGCVGAWGPCLGPTGLTLRDWSGLKNHGLLTNMDPGTDWVVNGGRYALDFDGSNDYVDLGTNSFFSTGAFSISWWEKINVAAGFNAVCGFKTSSGRMFIVYRSTTVNYQYLTFRDSAAGAAAGFRATAASNPSSVIGEWRHFTICGSNVNSSTASDYVVYENGVALSVTSAGNFSAATQVNAIGRDGLGTFNNVQIAEIVAHNRQLSQQENRLLASRCGIAYQLAPRRRSSVAVAAFNRRRRLLVGAGL